MEQPKTHQEDQLDLKSSLNDQRRLYFICNKLHDSDDNEKKYGGLRRYTEDRTAKILCDWIAIYLSDASNRFKTQQTD